jgi:hypothetical protein
MLCFQGAKAFLARLFCFDWEEIAPSALCALRDR